MRVLVTGASGFIGRNLVEYLARFPEKFHVTALWFRSEDFPGFVRSLKAPAVSCASVDLSDPVQTSRMISEQGADYDAIIHLAANGDPVLSRKHPYRDLQDTQAVALNVFTNFSARRLILFSSGAVYEGNRGVVTPRTPCEPVLPYAVTHLAAERYAKWAQKEGRFGSVQILRFFGAYGPHEPKRKIFTRLCKSFGLERKKEFVLRGDGQNRIDAMWVGDTVRAIQAVLESDVGSGTWDLVGGESMTLEDLVRRAAKILGVKEVRINYEGEVAEAHKFWADPRGMEETFGFRAKVPLEEGLPRLCEWVREKGNRG